MRVLVAAGGTGGHVYPALALGEELRTRGHDVTFVGVGRIEARLVPEAGFDLRTLPARGLPRTLSLDAVRAAGALAASMRVARGIVAELEPDVVVGMGGYVSVAPCVAARLAGRAVLLHEQNAKLMLSHRLSMRAARVLAVSLPLVRTPRRVRVVSTGNPLRRQIVELAAAPRAARRAGAAARLGLDAGATTVLVVGASQGAAALNSHAPEALDALGAQVLHLAGPDRETEVRYTCDATVLGYVDAIQDAYAVADVVVSRAGATTIAELLALGLPSVLVPLPSGGYQRANAELAAGRGAAAHVPQGDGFPARLRAAIEPLIRSDDARASMSAAALALARPDAARRLADAAEDASGG